jgi:small subunit ribosomal protein S2
MQTLTHKELLDAGCHFGHLKRKWNPQMRPFIFAERNGIHVIDLNATLECLDIAGKALRSMAKAGKKILFVGTKKQSRTIIADAANSVGMPFVTERWLGGMMTNFATVRRSVRKMQSIQRMLQDNALETITKKERLMLTRQYEKLDRMFGGIAQLNRLPNTLIAVDVMHEHLAIAEAKRLGLKTIGIVDTNSDPNVVDFPIPANDDASKSISLIVNFLASAIKEGLEERKLLVKDEPATATGE